jgi:hypothetical protein
MPPRLRSSAAASVLGAALERLSPARIALLGVAAFSGPLVSIYLLWEGTALWLAVLGGVLAQAALVSAVCICGGRHPAWWIALAYTALSWVFAGVLVQRLRSSPACGQYLNTSANARLIVSAVLVLAAVVLALVIAAIARLPHLGVGFLLVLAFVLAVVTVPGWPQERINHMWTAIGSSYFPTSAYSAVCGLQVSIESKPATRVPMAVLGHRTHVLDSNRASSRVSGASLAVRARRAQC